MAEPAPQKESIDPRKFMEEQQQFDNMMKNYRQETSQFTQAVPMGGAGAPQEPIESSAPKGTIEDDPHYQEWI